MVTETEKVSVMEVSNKSESFVCCTDFPFLLFFACLNHLFFSLFSVGAPRYLGSSIDTLFFKSDGALIVSMKR